MSHSSPNPNAEADISRIVASARRLGIELNDSEVIQWLTAMAAETGSDISIDAETGIFGHKIVMLDFSSQELARFRAIGELVSFEDQPGRVETALALSGSSAQSKIQTFPGDCDYFERVNILASTRTEACQILADLIRKKCLDTLKGPTYQLIEAKFGSFLRTVKVGNKTYKAGTPISWKPNEIQAGYKEAADLEGNPLTLSWESVAQDPGWCKLDWVVADPLRGQLANASNMLDVTWEAPDGSITPLDGYLDPYFQEVYLEAESVPVFSKLVKHVSTDALDRYVEQLEKEVRKYLTQDINFGKAAKRMYNIFRLTGRYESAALLRELFDEPTTMLYQVWSLIRTIDDSVQPDSSITEELLVAQTDHLIVSVVKALEDDQETEIVRLLLRLRDALTSQEAGQALTSPVQAARAEIINIVNNFFYTKLTEVPEIKQYMDRLTVG